MKGQKPTRLITLTNNGETISKHEQYNFCVICFPSHLATDVVTGLPVRDVRLFRGKFGEISFSTMPDAGGCFPRKN